MVRLEPAFGGKAGQRVAVAISAERRRRPERGDALVQTGSYAASYRLDVVLDEPLASGAQVTAYGIVPQVLPAFAGISVFRWDINIRESTVLGLVGAAGLACAGAVLAAPETIAPLLVAIVSAWAIVTGALQMGVARELRKAVEGHRFVYEGTPIPITISVGVAVLPDPAVKDASDIVSLADQALYKSKHAGRNRVTRHEPG